MAEKMKVEVVVSFDKLFSVEVEVDAVAGEPDLEAAEKEALKLAPAIIRDEVFRMTEAEIGENVKISGMNEV